MDIRIIKPLQGSVLRGQVTMPPSKSLSHRALIAAFLSGCTAENLAGNTDIAATRGCLSALRTGGVLECGESGSTMRFLMPLSLVLRETAVFTGSPGLLRRPMEPYFNFFDAERLDNGYRLRGKLQPGRYPLKGNVSSQFVTGLMFALPMLGGNSEIILTSPLESKPYADMTVQVLSAFGIDIKEVSGGYFIPGNQKYRPCHYTVEGDQSAAAFWRVANALGAEIDCKGLNPRTVQGDSVMESIIQNHERVIDVRECPDLVPALAVLCCFGQGESRIVNAGRLRLKESDRLSTISAELNRLGAKIEELPESLIIQGVASLAGGDVYGHNDHRIAMALAIAAMRCRSPVTIHGAECTEKSYPRFFEDFKSLGGYYEQLG